MGLFFALFLMGVPMALAVFALLQTRATRPL
ncbi:MAG: hypothetical protein JWQ05_3540 [Methylobacterium sp.]|jgi:hypothetical protein|nr:hypothetical protein [Methylobacterium sp.]